MSNLPPAGSLNLVHYFPDHPTKQFPAGEIVRFFADGVVLLGGLGEQREWQGAPAHA